jgi:DNA topoisomerase-1
VGHWNRSRNTRPIYWRNSCRRLRKNFKRNNKKVVADGGKVSELDERLETVKEMEKKFNKENNSGKVEAEGRGPTIGKIEAVIVKLDQRVETCPFKLRTREITRRLFLAPR